MTLLQHAMNIAGFTPGIFAPSQIKPGFTVTKVQWNGCMATVRKVVDVGEVVEHRMGSTDDRCPGVMVKYDNRGMVWEPYDHFRKVSDELEVWS